MIFSRICQIASLLSLLLSVSMLGGLYYSYRWLKSTEYEKYIKNKIMNNIDNVLPDAIKGNMPEFTAPPSPLPKTSISL